MWLATVGTSSCPRAGWGVGGWAAHPSGRKWRLRVWKRAENRHWRSHSSLRRPWELRRGTARPPGEAMGDGPPPGLGPHTWRLRLWALTLRPTCGGQTRAQGCWGVGSPAGGRQVSLPDAGIGLGRVSRIRQGVFRSLRRGVGSSGGRNGSLSAWERLCLRRGCKVIIPGEPACWPSRSGAKEDARCPCPLPRRTGSHPSERESVSETRAEERSQGSCPVFPAAVKLVHDPDRGPAAAWGRHPGGPGPRARPGIRGGPAGALSTLLISGTARSADTTRLALGCCARPSWGFSAACLKRFREKPGMPSVYGCALHSV